MSGRLKRNSHGQMALMDSLVFFTVALAVCGVLVSYVRPIPEPSMDVQGDADPGEMLTVILRTSIGRAMSIDIGGRCDLDGTESVATCLTVEVHALSSGTSAEAFSPLNSVIMDIMISVCNPAFDPDLSVYDLNAESPVPVITLSHRSESTDDRYASSAEIPGTDGRSLLVVLTLSPAALPELA